MGVMVVGILVVFDSWCFRFDSQWQNADPVVVRSCRRRRKKHTIMASIPILLNQRQSDRVQAQQNRALSFTHFKHGLGVQQIPLAFNPTTDFGRRTKHMPCQAIPVALANAKITIALRFSTGTARLLRGIRYRRLDHWKPSYFVVFRSIYYYYYYLINVSVYSLSTNPFTASGNAGGANLY